MKPVYGELVENRVIVWNIENSRRLYSEGYFGKPLGVAKPKGKDFDAPLILDLIEAYYLVRTKMLRVRRAGRRVGVEQLRSKCLKEYVGFREKYTVYHHLRSLGYVVTPGIKFGCDFAVYRHGPGIDHAPFLIQVMKPSDEITATHMVLSGRLATTVRKQFLIASVSGNEPTYLAFDWWRA
ncbi:MAG: tRNA-intron lyase [Nitrososphaerota archaeon]|jgi:tRNA-intron endonuclease|nr:tRNA-intron lyase [Nitrososphaerota archaeon]